MHADWVQDVTAAEWRCFIRRHPPPPATFGSVYVYSRGADVRA